MRENKDQIKLNVLHKRVLRFRNSMMFSFVLIFLLSMPQNTLMISNDTDSFGLESIDTCIESSYENSFDINLSTFIEMEKPMIQNNQDVDDQYYILQLTGPIITTWKDQLEELGVIIIGYVPDYSFLCYLNSISKTTILQLPYIEDIIPYSPEMKCDPKLLSKCNDQLNQQLVDLIISYYPIEGESTLNSIIEEVNQFNGQVLSTTPDRLELISLANNLKNLIEIPEILWVESSPDFQYFNDVASDIIKSNSIWADLDLDGTGQIVTVCDTGLDNGSYKDLHEDFRGRLLHAYDIGRIGDWSDDDISSVSGHGTHVAGSVLGGGNHSGGQIKGMAYNASLVFQSTIDQFGGMAIPSDLYWGLYFPPYSQYNSRIHTNSWGDPQNAGKYNTWSNVTDRFIWDYPDQVILFAAGNIIPFPPISKVSPPGTSKNVITVGASESYRQTPTFPGHATDVDNIDERASFSCFETDDKRLKPDILCPGSGILSTRSSMIVNPNTNYWLGYDAFYAYGGGTSMSTPITAGAATLIRQYYTDIESVQPSAALIKATLINGAEDMPTTGGNTQPIPNYEEGWGRINLSKSINPEEPTRLFFIENVTGINTLHNISYTIEVLNDSVPLNITLVWSDHPASPTATTSLVNDLHLNLTHFNSGVGYKGNVFDNGWSSQDDSDANSEWDKYSTGYDNINNVECFRIKNPQLGRYKLTVVGSNVPIGPQPFSVVLSGGLNTNLLAPTNLLITNVPTGNALNLSWDRVLGTNITNYEIFRSTQPDSGFVLVNQTISQNTKRYSDNGLIDGIKYYYKLRTNSTTGIPSKFSPTASGTPSDSVAPWVKILSPKQFEILTKIVPIKYDNESDCQKIIFRFYNDSNKNGLPDDVNSWQTIGVDTVLNGSYLWNTSQFDLGINNDSYLILSAESNDEVPNSNTVMTKDLVIDNNPPDAPVFNPFTPNPINQTNVQLKGIVEDDTKEVQVYSNNNFLNNVSVSVGSVFSIDVQLYEGLNLITARAIDVLGNGPGPASDALEIMVDTEPPTADAGNNFIINEGSWVTFNGSKSFDGNPNPKYNQITAYQWSFKHFNSTKVLLEGVVVNYYFDTMGNYTITLSVQDKAGNWDEQEFWVLVLDKTKPKANASLDFEWFEDSILNLVSDNSTDNDPDLYLTGNFTWTFYDFNVSNIKSGKNKLVQLYSYNVSYIFNTPGKFNITLTVTDIAGNWDYDWVIVTIRDITPPNARAGTDQIIIEGRSAFFNGSDSTDNDPNFPQTGNFTWFINFVGHPVYLYGMIVELKFSLTNVLSDVVSVRLTVTDVSGNKDTDDITIRINGDNDYPTVVWTYPKNKADSIPITSVIKIQFNETIDIDKTPLNSTTFHFLDGESNQLGGDLVYNKKESIILFIPSELLDFGKSYTVFIHNSIVDLAGNQLDGNANGRIQEGSKDNFKIVFSTMNISLNPSKGTTNVPLNSEIKVEFDVGVSNHTLNSAQIRLFDQVKGIYINGSTQINNDSNMIIFKPIRELILNGEYKVTLDLDFYLLTFENISWNDDNRELLILPDDLINNTGINVTSKTIAWTFNTVKTESSSDEDFLTRLFGDNLWMLIIILIVIVILIIVIVLLVIRKKRSRDVWKDSKAGYRRPIAYGDYNDYDYDRDYSKDPSRRKSKRKPMKLKTKRSKKSKELKKGKVSSTRKRLDHDEEEYEDEDEYYEDEDYEDDFTEADETEIEWGDDKEEYEDEYEEKEYYGEDEYVEEYEDEEYEDEYEDEEDYYEDEDEYDYSDLEEEWVEEELDDELEEEEEWEELDDEDEFEEFDEEDEEEWEE